MTKQTETQDQEDLNPSEAPKAESVEPSKPDAEQPKAEKPKKDKTIKIKQSEYQKLVDEAAENKDKYVRLFAEFDNARKRMDREKIEFVKYANEELLMEFIGLFDNLELSLNAVKNQDQKTDSVIKGIEMVLIQAQEILKKNGVTVIEAKGKPFDPHMHEVLMQEPTDECEEGIVLEEFQKGYLLGEKVIRTVKVKVSAAKA